MNIFGFGNGSDITLLSAGGISLVNNGTGPNLQTKGLTAGANITFTPGANAVTIAAASGAGVYLPLDGSGTMAGDLKMGTYNISGVGSVNGIAASNIVSNAGTGAVGNLPTFVSAKVVGDSGTALSSLASTSSLGAYLPKAGGAMSGTLTINAPLVMNSTSIYGVNLLQGTTTSRNANDLIGDVGNGVTGNLSMYSGVGGGKFISDAGIPASVVVTGTGAGTVGNIAIIANINGKVVSDSGVAVANVVTGPASAVANNIAVYSGTTGKLITNSTGGIGTIGALTLANTTASTTTGTGAFICPGGAGIAGAVNVGGVIKINDGTAGSLGAGALVVTGGIATGKDVYVGGTVTTPTIVNGFTDADKVLCMGSTNGAKIAHTTGFSLDTHSGAFTSAGGGVSTGQFRWRTVDATGAAWQNAMTLSNGGNLAVTGSVTALTVATTGTTDSTSTSTGAVVTSGGLGVAKQARFGGKVTISSGLGAQGFDTATGDVYANMRVLQNTTGPDNDMYIGFQSGGASSLRLYSANSQTVYMNRNNMVVGAAVAAAATDGFLYIPTVSATKTGTPTAYSGTVPMVFDTSANRLVVYTGGTWKSIGPFA